MNGKKVLTALALVVAISVLALYIVPIMAYQNGALDQDRIRDCAQNCERDRERLCLQNGNCTCQNADCLQNRYRYQFQYEECAEQMGIEVANKSCYRNQERHRMGH